MAAASGLTFEAITKDSPGARAGLTAGDVVVRWSRGPKGGVVDEVREALGDRH